MIVINGERDILIGLFSGRLDPENDGKKIQTLDEIPESEVCAIYLGDGGFKSFPDMLVVDTPNMREFFAWSSTYLPQWSPLSSNITTIAKQDLNSHSLINSKSFPSGFSRGLLCLTIGELLYEWRLANEQTLPSLLSLRSTFGYAATCSLLAGRNCLDDLLSRWARSQHLLQLNPRRINSKTLKSVWAPIFSIAKSNVSLEDIDSTVKELGKVVSSKSKNTLFDAEGSFAHVTAIGSRREDVVVELESFVASTKLDEVFDCFVASSIAAKMSAVPLSHFEVFGDMTNSEPRSLLWYSFLSGYLASEKSSPSMERLLFQLEGDLRSKRLVPPDISIDELDALLGAAGELPNWVGIGAKFINVELRPGVCSAFRLRNTIPTATNQLASSHMDDRTLFEGALEQLRDLFEKKATKPDTDVERKQTKKKPRKKRKS